MWKQNSEESFWNIYELSQLNRNPLSATLWLDGERENVKIVFFFHWWWLNILEIPTQLNTYWDDKRWHRRLLNFYCENCNICVWRMKTRVFPISHCCQQQKKKLNSQYVNFAWFLHFQAEAGEHYCMSPSPHSFTHPAKRDRNMWNENEMNFPRFSTISQLSSRIVDDKKKFSNLIKTCCYHLLAFVSHFFSFLQRSTLKSN